MTLFKYLDLRYRTLSLELQIDYTIAKEAELKAAYTLIQGQRSLFKWATIPVLIVKYLLINLRLMKAPEAFKPKTVEDPVKESETKEVVPIHVQ